MGHDDRRLRVDRRGCTPSAGLSRLRLIMETSCRSAIHRTALLARLVSERLETPISKCSPLDIRISAMGGTQPRKFEPSDSPNRMPRHAWHFWNSSGSCCCLRAGRPKFLKKVPGDCPLGSRPSSGCQWRGKASTPHASPSAASASAFGKLAPTQRGADFERSWIGCELLTC